MNAFGHTIKKNLTGHKYGCDFVTSRAITRGSKNGDKKGCQLYKKRTQMFFYKLQLLLCSSYVKKIFTKLVTFHQCTMFQHVRLGFKPF